MKSSRSESGSAISAEFIACFIVFTFFILLPLIELLTAATAYASVWFINNAVTKEMGNCRDFQTGLKNVQAMATQLSTGPCVLFAKNSKVMMTVYIVRTKITTGISEFVGPNCRSIEAPDSNAYIYEYSVVSKGWIEPAIPLTTIPLLKDIPGVGRAMPVSCRSYAAVEDLGLISQAAPGPNWGGGGGGGYKYGFYLTSGFGGPAAHAWKPGIP